MTASERVELIRTMVQILELNPHYLSGDQKTIVVNKLVDLIEQL